MNKYQKLAIAVLISLICITILTFLWYLYGGTGTKIESRDDAINYLKQKYPDLKQYPSDTLPPRSIESENSSSGWHIAFIQNGSGVPYISAKCYYVRSNGRITEKSYSRDEKEGIYTNFSAKDCKPTADDMTEIPQDCTSWFDGCNTCSVNNGKLEACTLMYCENPRGAKCVIYK